MKDSTSINGSSSVCCEVPLAERSKCDQRVNQVISFVAASSNPIFVFLLQFSSPVLTWIGCVNKHIKKKYFALFDSPLHSHLFVHLNFPLLLNKESKITFPEALTSRSLDVSVDCMLRQLHPFIHDNKTNVFLTEMTPKVLRWWKLNSKKYSHTDTQITKSWETLINIHVSLLVFILCKTRENREIQNFHFLRNIMLLQKSA